MSTKNDFVIRILFAENGYAIKYYPANSYDEDSEILEVFPTSAKALKRAKEILVSGIEETLFIPKIKE
jgi:hypothetical protein